MNMEEELTSLRQKVNRLEDMMYTLNSKIGQILEKFLNHRAGQLADICKVLQGDEGVCLSLVAQLQSCVGVISGRENDTRPTPNKSHHSGSGPGINSTSMNSERRLQPNRTTRANTSAATPKSCVIITSEMPEDTLAGSPESPHTEEDIANLSSSVHGSQDFIDTVKVEPFDENILPDTSEEIEDIEMLMQSYSTLEHADDADDDPESDPDFRCNQSMKKERDTQSLRRGRRFVKKKPKLHRSFKSLTEAKTQIKAEGLWAVKTTSRTSLGLKIYHICKSDYKCPVRMEHHLNDDGSVSEFMCGEPSDHVHRAKRYSEWGLQANIKQTIEDIFYEADGVTDSGKIYKELVSRTGDGTISKHKVQQYVGKLKEKRYGDLSFMRQTKECTSSKSKSRLRRPVKEKGNAITTSTVPDTGDPPSSVSKSPNH